MRAGVSLATASRVLNNSHRVSDASRAAVEKAMRELDYQPDQYARSLRKTGSRGKLWTGNVGMVFLNTTVAMLEVPFVARMVHGVQSELAGNGYNLMISNTDSTDVLPDMVRDRKVEGLIVHGDLEYRACEQLSAAMPVVSVGQNSISLPLCTVNVNNEAAIFVAIKALCDSGHRRIAFVNIEGSHRDFVERLSGYHKALQALGLPQNPQYVSVGDRGQAGPRAPLDEPLDMTGLVNPLFDLAEPPTALLVANDWQAISVYRALLKRGIRIPQDVSVVGFDNDSRICHSLNPTLSSLDYPSELLGRQAVRLLFARLKDNTAMQGSLLIDATFHRRASCADIPGQ